MDVESIWRYIFVPGGLLVSLVGVATSVGGALTLVSSFMVFLFFWLVLFFCPCFFLVLILLLLLLVLLG